MSPHLLRYNERICIAGVEVSEAQLCQAFDFIDKAREEIALTFFEFATLAAMWVFQHSDIDLAVLEVGLGGRLDAVNCFDADIALVTAIDIDHVVVFAAVVIHGDVFNGHKIAIEVLLHPHGRVTHFDTFDQHMFATDEADYIGAVSIFFPLESLALAIDGTFTGDGYIVPILGVNQTLADIIVRIGTELGDYLGKVGCISAAQEGGPSFQVQSHQALEENRAAQIAAGRKINPASPGLVGCIYRPLDSLGILGFTIAGCSIIPDIENH